MNWWQRLRKRDELEDQLDAELRYHFDRQATVKDMFVLKTPAWANVYFVRR